MQTKTNDSASIGAIVGLILPLISMGVIFLVSSFNFSSYEATYQHMENFNLLYKILSLSLMPNVGLFFFWTKRNKIIQARALLMTTLFYGVFVFILYV